MKILFFMNPQIVEGNPFIHKVAIEFFANHFINILSNEPDYEFVVAAGEHMRPYNSHSKARSVHIPVNSTEDEIVQLTDFDPDIVMLFTPNAHITLMFPNALVLHQEYSIFSRSPFPTTIYLDPVGHMTGVSYLDAVKEEIGLRPFKNLGCIDSFASRVCSHISKINPFTRPAGFDKIGLLPLSGGDITYLDSVIVSTLRQMPKNYGLIVTSHPYRNYLSSVRMRSLQAEFKNLIWDDSYEDYHGASQYLIEFADFLIIDQQTSVSFQSLIWQIPALTRDGRGGVCYDGKFPEDIDIKVKPWEKLSILHWILSRYAIPKFKMEEKGFLDRILRNAVNNVIFKEFDNFDCILNRYLEIIEMSKPVKAGIPCYSRDKMIRILLQYEKALGRIHDISKTEG